MNPTYLRLELIRLIRNRQNFGFSLILPVVLYLIIAGSNKNQVIGDISFPTYYLGGMIALGGMSAMVSGGARIAFEREVGWTRQLRLSPLKASAYLQTKVLTSYVMAGLTIAAVYVAAAALGVSMPVARWIEMTVLIIVGLIPFAGLGIMVGHLIRGESMGPVISIGTSLFAILGGAYFQLGEDGSILHNVSECSPSYWIVQAGHTAIGGDAWGVRGWLTVAIWSVLASYGAVWAYRRDTARA